MGNQELDVESRLQLALIGIGEALKLALLFFSELGSLHGSVHGAKGCKLLVKVGHVQLLQRQQAELTPLPSLDAHLPP